jgi:hypothetical protein
MPNKSGRGQDGRFQPGVSGNPGGMPKGTKHHATRMVERLFENDAEEIACGWRKPREINTREWTGARLLGAEAGRKFSLRQRVCLAISGKSSVL